MNDNTALWWVIKGPVVASIMVRKSNAWLLYPRVFTVLCSALLIIFLLLILAKQLNYDGYKINSI